MRKLEPRKKVTIEVQGVEGKTVGDVVNETIVNQTITGNNDCFKFKVKGNSSYCIIDLAPDDMEKVRSFVNKVTQLYEELDDMTGYYLEDKLNAEEYNILSDIIPVDYTSGLPVHTLSGFEVMIDKQSESHERITAAIEMETELNKLFSNYNMNQAILLYSESQM